jgi:hypothetical protein
MVEKNRESIGEALGEEKRGKRKQKGTKGEERQKTRKMD